MNLTPSEAFEAAIASAGGPSALAKALDVDPQLITNWRRRGLPDKRVLAVEAAIDGVVTRHQLAPSIYPAEGTVRADAR